MTTDMSSLTEKMRDVLAPLGAEEERRAIEAALAARGGHRENLLVRGAELAIEKAGRNQRPHRRVRVLLTVRAESVVHEILVDVHGKVVADRDLGPRNLPYLEAEVREARAIAERDERVARRLAGFQVGVGTFAPTLRASDRHRLVGLHFLDVSNPDIPKALTSVVVDLATGQLVHDTHHGHEPRRA